MRDNILDYNVRHIMNHEFHAIVFDKHQFLLARLFYKTEEILSPPARRRRLRQRLHLRLRQRPVKFWGKLLRQKIMSSFISSLAQNLFIFAVLIHMVVLINNQALINIQIYYFSHVFHVFSNVST